MKEVLKFDIKKVVYRIRFLFGHECTFLIITCNYLQSYSVVNVSYKKHGENGEFQQFQRFCIFARQYTLLL